MRQAIFDFNAAGGNNVTLDRRQRPAAHIFVQAGMVSVAAPISTLASDSGLGARCGPGRGGTDNHAINVGLRFSW